MNSIILMKFFAVATIPILLLPGDVSSRFRINFLSFRRIQLGMPYEQVRALIGKPGVYHHDKIELAGVMIARARSIWAPEYLGDAFEGDSSRKVWGDWQEQWYGPFGAITISFDEKGFVVWKRFQQMSEKSLFERLYHWFAVQEL